MSGAAGGTWRNGIKGGYRRDEYKMLHISIGLIISIEKLYIKNILL